MKAKIKRMALKAGAAGVGVAATDRLGGKPSMDPNYLLPGARSIISLMIPYDGETIRRYLGKEDHAGLQRAETHIYGTLYRIGKDIESFLIEEGFRHKGFACIDILQPCVSFNKVNTFQWYKKRVYDINEERDYDYEDKFKAFERALQWGDRIPIGILYKKERITRHEQDPLLKNSTLVNQSFDSSALEKLLQTFR